MAELRKFPDETYSLDPAAQRTLSRLATSNRRRFAWLLSLVALGILVLPLSALYPGMPWVTGGIFLVAIFGFLDTKPRAEILCSQCAATLEPKWMPGAGGGQDLFLVCENCRTYVYTHRRRE